MKKHITNLIRKIRLRTWVAIGIIIVLAPLAFAAAYGILGAIGGSNATPIAYWNFDEGVDNTCSGGSSDACDSSGNGRDIAFAATTAAPTWQTEDNCVSGKCIWLDGSNDRANTGNSPGLPTGNFSYTLWIKPNTSAGTLLMASDGSGGNELVIGINGAQGSVVRLFLNNSDVLSSNQSIPANSWTHIAITRSSSTVTIYINGKADATGTAGATLGFSTCPLLIGVDADASCSGTLGGFYHGYMDEIKIYNTALSQSHIQAEFAGGSAVLGDSVDSRDFLNDGLVGYWPLDESSGNASDRSGNGTTLTNNSSTSYSAGKFGLAIEPDGTADYMEAADNATLSITGSLTLAAWINNDDTTGSQNIIGKWDGTNNSYLLALEGDELRMYIDSASDYQTTTSANVGSNSFVHVAGVYDANAQTVKLYINGVEQASTTTGTIPSSIGDDAGEFVIGADDSSANFFDGHIDEARVYNRAFSPSEIKALYNWAPGAVAYYDFNENTGSTVYDRSGNGVNGSITTATYITGKFGGALDFPASGHVQMTESDIHDLGLSDMTITAWVRRDGAATPFSNPMIVVGKRNNAGAGDGYDLKIDGNTSNCNTSSVGQSGICVEIDEGADIYTIGTSSTALNDGQWHHIAVTFDRDTATNNLIYVDGIAQTTTRSGTLANIGSIANAVPLCIGKTGSTTSCAGSDNVMNGAIDEVRIYKYVRTEQQLIEDMNASHPAGGSPIGSQIGYWKFDELTGTTAYNRVSVHGNNLTLTNSPTWSTSGKINGALDFESSSSQYAEAVDSASLSQTGSITLAAWINPESTTAATSFPIAAKGQNYQLLQFGDEIRMVIDGSGNYETTNSANLQTGTWYHVLGVYDANTQTIKIYINGILQDSTTTGTIPSSITDGTANFAVGRFATGTEQTFQIAATADDVLEIANTTLVNNNNQDAFGRVDSSGGILHAGIRFNNVTINQGETISDAYIQVFGNTSVSLSPTSVQARIYGDDADDAAAWSSSSRPSQITQTTANVEWDPSSWIDNWNNSPSIASIIQEIVNRGGWSSGNDVRLAILHDGSGNNIAASFQDYTGNSSQAARLVVTTGASASYYDGLIDEVQLYSSALTEDQVKIVYSANSAVNFGTGYDAASNIVDGAGASPVGFWPLDENTGTSTVFDKSSNSTNLSMNGSMTGDDWVVGKFGSALDFDGTNDYLQATDPNILDMGTSNFTLSAWVWRDTDTTVDQIIDKRSTGDGTVCSVASNVGYDFLIWDSDHLSVSICDGTNGWEMYSSPGVVTTGSWHHVVAVVNRSSLSSSQLYLDGVAISNTKINDGSDPPAGNSISNSTNFRIAGDLTGNYFWDGRIDNVQIYNYAQTPAQVAYDYNRGAPLLWYKMDDNVSGNGQTLANNAKNANGQAAGNNGTTDDGANNTGMDCTVSGKRNLGCDLDGTDDFISVTSPTLPTGDFTYAMWVNPDVAEDTLIMSANSGGSNEFIFLIDGSDSSRLKTTLDAGSADATSTRSIATGTWTHLAVTRVGGTITQYINGVADGTGSDSAVLNFANGGSFCNLYIGADADACTGTLGEYFDGDIDDVRIYGYGLSANQILKVMNEGAVRFGPNEGSP